jgi:hypothetical protein
MAVATQEGTYESDGETLVLRAARCNGVFLHTRSGKKQQTSCLLDWPWALQIAAGETPGEIQVGASQLHLTGSYLSWMTLERVAN